jgi:hypothetical protein
VTGGGRIVTDVCSIARLGGWRAAEPTLPELAKTCGGTTAANRRLANWVLPICAGNITFLIIWMLSMFPTLLRLMLRM